MGGIGTKEEAINLRRVHGVVAEVDEEAIKDRKRLKTDSVFGFIIKLKIYIHYRYFGAWRALHATHIFF